MLNLNITKSSNSTFFSSFFNWICGDVWFKNRGQYFLYSAWSLGTFNLRDICGSAPIFPLKRIIVIIVGNWSSHISIMFYISIFFKYKFAWNDDNSNFRACLIKLWQRVVFYRLLGCCTSGLGCLKGHKLNFNCQILAVKITFTVSSPPQTVHCWTNGAVTSLDIS